MRRRNGRDKCCLLSQPLTRCRPVSKNGELEDSPEDKPFDYDAEPENFYMNIETVGGMDAETCFQQGIRVLQQKVAAIIGELSPSGAPANGAPEEEYAPNSPSATNQGMAGTGAYTPYGGGAVGGGTSAWGGTTPYGGTTQYGATTPYGQQNGGW
jgi:DNA-directed RNA polymerase II subunit RPB3